MKKTYIIIIIIVLVLGSIVFQNDIKNSYSSETIQLTAELTKSEYDLDNPSPIEITLKFKNISIEPIILLDIYNIFEAGDQVFFLQWKIKRRLFLFLYREKYFIKESRCCADFSSPEKKYFIKLLQGQEISVPFLIYPYELSGWRSPPTLTNKIIDSIAEDFRLVIWSPITTFLFLREAIIYHLDSTSIYDDFFPKKGEYTSSFIFETDTDSYLDVDDNNFIRGTKKIDNAWTGKVSSNEINIRITDSNFLHKLKDRLILILLLIVLVLSLYFKVFRKIIMFLKYNWCKILKIIGYIWLVSCVIPILMVGVASLSYTGFSDHVKSTFLINTLLSLPALLLVCLVDFIDNRFLKNSRKNKIK